MKLAYVYVYASGCMVGPHPPPLDQPLDIVEPLLQPYDTARMRGFISRSILLFSKKVNKLVY